MKKIINESGVAFGEFNSDDLFYIEESDLYKSLGTGIKTEFIVLDQKDTIIFLEAKTGCPNPQNKEMGGEKTEKFVEFYNDISEKFIDSLQIYIAGLLEKYGKTEEIGENLMKVKPLEKKKLKFVLVITADEIKEEWLWGPKLELENRLLKLRKIWGISVIVLNKSLAYNYGLLSDSKEI